MTLSEYMIMWLWTKHYCYGKGFCDFFGKNKIYFLIVTGIMKHKKYKLSTVYLKYKCAFCMISLIVYSYCACKQ